MAPISWFWYSHLSSCFNFLLLHPKMNCIRKCIKNSHINPILGTHNQTKPGPDGSAFSETAKYYPTVFFSTLLFHLFFSGVDKYPGRLLKKQIYNRSNCKEFADFMWSRSARARTRKEHTHDLPQLFFTCTKPDDCWSSFCVFFSPLLSYQQTMVDRFNLIWIL